MRFPLHQPQTHEFRHISRWSSLVELFYAVALDLNEIVFVSLLPVIRFCVRFTPLNTQVLVGMSSSISVFGVLLMPGTDTHLCKLYCSKNAMKNKQTKSNEKKRVFNLICSRKNTNDALLNTYPASVSGRMKWEKTGEREPRTYLRQVELSLVDANSVSMAWYL